MQLKKINDKVSVAGQIALADVAAIKAAGFTAIVNNRPDGEAPDQPPGEDIRREAEKQGLAYHFIPVGRDGVSPAMLEATRAVLDGAGGRLRPALGYLSIQVSAAPCPFQLEPRTRS